MEELDRYKRAMSDLSALNRIATAINVQMDVDRICQEVVDQASRHVNSEQGAIYLVSEGSQDVAQMQTYIRDRSSESMIAPLHLTESIQGWMLKHKTALVSDDINTDERVLSQDGRRVEMSSLCALPLMTGGRYLGSLVAFNKSPQKRFAKEDVHFLGIVAHQTARVIQVAQLSHLQNEIVLRQQEERTAALAKLVAGISHELNTPLAALSSSSQTLMRLVASIHDASEISTNDGDRIRSAIEQNLSVIKVSSDRLGDLLLRLKRFVRLDRPHYASETIGAILENAYAMTNKKGKDLIDFAVHGESHTEVESDLSSLNVIFLNVFQNAVDAISNHGLIEIHVSADSDNITCQVVDNGKGIPGDQLNNIFDPSFTTKGNRVALGLGLAITQETLRRLGGQITIESEEGEGSRVNIMLPRKPRRVDG